MKISRHHSRVLDAIAHGAIGDIFPQIAKLTELLASKNGEAAYQAQKDFVCALRPILDKRLREAWEWGVSFKEAQPDEQEAIVEHIKI